MLMQQMRWLLPALIVLWTKLQLNVSLPTHNERTHVLANTFNPSTATATVENHKRGVHSSDDKNDTQFIHKLVASPAGLLRPDKFQFYTYNDNGDMITRQMTVEEIQGLIAAGGTDHVAIDRQEPQKTDDVLTGGKKVMDVVQKVQNVLKSALDKPPTLMGSIPQIPEHANIEWSNILPSILSGETDTISSNNETNQLLYKLNGTETIEAGNSAIEYVPLNKSVINATNIISTKNPVTPDIQSNVYAGFSNNMEYIEKPEHNLHMSSFTEKPMIPVPVITLTQQKLSTLQSIVTESPVFQILSVIPVEAAGNVYKKNQADLSTTNIDPTVSLTTELSAQIEKFNYNEQFIKLPTSEVLENSTLSQLTSLNTYEYPMNMTSNKTFVSKISTMSPNKITTSSYSITKASISNVSSTTDIMHNKPSQVTEKTSNKSSNYILIQNKNDTNPSEESLFVNDIMKEIQGNETYNGTNDKMENKISETNANIPGSISPVSMVLKPEKVSSNITRSRNETESTFDYSTEIEISTIPLDTDFNKDSSIATGEYTENSHHTQITGIQSMTSIEALSTQLVDSFSNVMNQIAGTGPSVLSLSSTSGTMSEILNTDSNYSNASDSIKTTGIATATIGYDMPISHNANQENIERIVTSQNYTTRKVPLHNVINQTMDYSTTQLPFTITNAGINNIFNSRITSTTSTISNIASLDNKIMVNNLTTTSNTELTDTTDMTDTTDTSSSIWIQLEKLNNVSLLNQTGPFATFEITTNNTPMMTYATDKIILPEEMSSVSSAAVVQSTISSIDINESLNKSTNEYLNSAFVNLNWSNPVSAIDQVLNTVPLVSSTPLLEPISLPNNTSNFLANDLASGLIAGFTTTEKSSLEEISIFNEITTLPDIIKFTESTENIIRIREETLELNDNYQEKKNITYTQVSTQKPLSNSNEKIINSTLEYLPFLENKSENISDELKDNIETSTLIAEVITINTTKQLSAMNETLFNSNNLDKKQEAVGINTELSQLPVKIELINFINDTRNENISIYTKNSPKSDILTQKNNSFVDVSLVTQKANGSESGMYSSHERISDIITNTAASIVNTENIENVLDTSIMQSIFAEVNGTTISDMNTMTTSIKPSTNNYTTTFSSFPPIQLIQEEANTDNTQQLSNNTNTDNKEYSRPNFINNTYYNNTLNENNKEHLIPQYIAHTISTENASVSDLLLKDVPVKGNGQLNNTESKVTSLKQSENLSKPEIIHLQSQTQPSNIPIRQASKPAYSHKISEKPDTSKSEINANIHLEDKWTLISPPTMTKVPKPPAKPSRKPVNHIQMSSNLDENINVRAPVINTTTLNQQNIPQSESVLPLDASQTVSGLDATVKHTSPDIVNFAKLCNELAFNFWVATNKGLSTARSLALSPFGMTSLLAMIFLGARGPTSDQMNEVLGLDDVATFNPHLVFQNITDTVSLARGQGIANAAFVRELFADKMKVRKLMPFYKEQAQQFYEGLVAEVNFATISDLVRRRTNLLIRKQTGGRIKDFVKTNTVPLRSPLAALSANVFQTDCNNTLTSSVGRDGELYFAVSPAVRQRKLIPVPATTWRLGVLAGYEPSIDATAVALGGNDKLVSTIFILPGQQGHTAPGDTLDRLEQRLVRGAFRDGIWNKLLKVLIPRNGLELQVPKFSHRSVVNATAALKRMGLDELFSGNADFKGINGIGHRLYLADVLQMNLFSTCGDENILIGRHHVETYPASPLRSIRQRMEDSDSVIVTQNDRSRHDAIPFREDYINSFYPGPDQLPMERSYREKRQITKSSERPRLKLDRPFLYFVRHNPSGIILHMGRFNPRLLP